MGAIYTISQAYIVAAGLTATDLDNWTYTVSNNGNGTAYVGVYDDLGDFIDYLGLHLVAAHRDGNTRITGGGHTIDLLGIY
jgi:hypothetical protein